MARKYDFYKNREEPGDRLAVPAGANLPEDDDRVYPSDWVLLTDLTPSSPELHVEGLEEGMRARGFYLFKLV